jgi:hypothetical protein
MIRFVVAGAIAAFVVASAMPAAARDGEHQMDMSGHKMADMSAPSDMVEAGQAAFASISEVVAKLRADPATDWSKVNIDALRSHLVDMDNVLIRARVTAIPVPRGARFEISGDGAVRDSIRRMVAAHTSMADGEDGRQVVSTPTEGGATMTVLGADDGQQAQIRALGFFGLLTGGVHHQLHHLMMAKGEMHH